MVSSPNIKLTRSTDFGSPAYEVVERLLYMVDFNMMTAINKPMFSTEECVVVYKEEYPMCSRLGNQHIIFLSVKDNYWCQWVYQFAHEYCHHLINGSMTGTWSDLMWFEETICELSSLYNLQKMESICMINGLYSYAPFVNNYLEKCMNQEKVNCRIEESNHWYEKYAEVLREKEYERSLYNAIACLMLPHFIDNPCLWKIVLHIGDTRSWNSLDSLFEHLQLTSDDSYKESLLKVRRIFD